MLSAVDAEYRILHESVETLTEAQRERAAYLLMMHEEYQRSLALLQEERASILEDARLREANLRAQAEERTRELTLRIEQDQASLNEAMEELRRIGSEQERADRIESQMNGFYITVNSQIFAGRLTEASVTLSAMREFLEAPFLQNISGFETRKQNHLAAINFMESAITASLNGASAGVQGELTELRARNETLEQRNANLERDIAVFGAQGSDQARIIAEYAAAIQGLENVRTEQQQIITRRENENRTLETENVRLAQQVSEIQTRYDDLQGRAEAALRVFTGESTTPP